VAENPTPTVVRWFAEGFGGSTQPRFRTPGPAELSTGRFGAAAEYARARYPGRVGELVRREILAYEDLAHRFDGSGLIPRLVDELLAERGVDRDSRT
jgi:hypothetical protein